MTDMTRYKTKYPGVLLRVAERVGGSGLEKIYYMAFKRDGKTVEAKAGRQYMDDMTPAKAANLRAGVLEGKQQTRKEVREARAAAKTAEQARPTLACLLEAYRQSKPDRNWATDMSLFTHYLEVFIGNTTLSEIRTADMDASRPRMPKAGKSAQTTKQALALVKRIIRFGVKHGLTPMPAPSRLSSSQKWTM